MWSLVYMTDWELFQGSSVIFWANCITSETEQLAEFLRRGWQVYLEYNYTAQRITVKLSMNLAIVEIYWVTSIITKKKVQRQFYYAVKSRKWEVQPQALKLHDEFKDSNKFIFLALRLEALVQTDRFIWVTFDFIFMKEL